jgi:hypothetical protein
MSDIPTIDNRYRGATVDRSTTIDNRGGTIINGPVVIVDRPRRAPSSVRDARAVGIPIYTMNPAEATISRELKERIA